MSFDFPILQVASGRDAFSVLDEMMIHRSDSEYVYHPGGRVTGRLMARDENLTPINQEWLDKWHRENPDYELRSVHYRRHSGESPHAFGPRRAIAMPTPDEVAEGHHQVHADVVHTPTNTKVGDDMLFSLASWPRLDTGQDEGSRSHATTAHIWSFYRHDPPAAGQPDPHHGIMTKVLDSWLNHVKSHGIHHGFVMGDVSKGYWLKNITRHPDMVWGGVEYSNESGGTRHAARMDPRRIATLQKHPQLFQGWPGTRVKAPEPEHHFATVGESDALVMRWNQEHPTPSNDGGPIPTTLHKFEKGRMKSYPGHLDKMCYRNALRLAKKNPKMKLAIGFVVSQKDAQEYESGGDSPLMFTHAWNITAKGEIHDATLGSDRAASHRYYGRVVDASRFKNHDELAGWFGKHFQGMPRGANSLHFGYHRTPVHDEEA